MSSQQSEESQRQSSPVLSTPELALIADATPQGDLPHLHLLLCLGMLK